MEKKSIYIYDLDGTLIDSNTAVRECQIEGLISLLGKSKDDSGARLSAESKLKDLGLKGAVNSLGFELDCFFKEHYHTFDPFEATKQGRVYTFPDAKEALNAYKDRPKILISNSEINATNAKLDALSLNGVFNQVYAECTKGKSKPDIYMGEKALDYLSDKNLLSGNPKILLVGDQEIDLQFGQNIKKKYSNLVNILIDRKGSYKGSVNPDAKISSLNETGSYE